MRPRALLEFMRKNKIPLDNFFANFGYFQGSVLFVGTGGGGEALAERFESKEDRGIISVESVANAVVESMRAFFRLSSWRFPAGGNFRTSIRF